jgi:predicted pyridoxine 5'-phosphate oxidase superfamily flavin-nucleotide-binding protein
MGHQFAEIAFTENVRAAQRRNGSRDAYAGLDGGEAHNERLGPDETAFIADRDSFYMATVSETGWPYVQHRGGPPGFLRVLDERTIGFADFRGNRQYVSLGNLAANDRVSLFLMDYPRRARLKILGHARVLGADEPMARDRLAVPGYRGLPERGFVIEVRAFDWNCSQHVTPRYTETDVARIVAGLNGRIDELEAQLAATGSPA